MPLPNDEKLIALAQDLIQQLDAIFGMHPGFRPAHAKGVMLSGTFVPSPEAATLSRAPHLNQAATPVTVRFSNSTGVPVIPDNDPNSDPRGMAVRFHLGEHVHTDMVCHATDGFPTRTGQEFLEFLRAVAAGKVEAFLCAHPAAMAYVQTPKPTPSSFARETYFGVTAMQFINKDGVSRYGRYRIVPEAGNDHLSPEAAADKGAEYLFDEIAGRIASGPLGFDLFVQLANDGDTVDDATIHWPADRPVMNLGKITLTAPVANNAVQQKHIIFDPIPRVDGIEPSADPLLELRAAIYLISGRRRRTAA
jgi:catalase